MKNVLFILSITLLSTSFSQTTDAELWTGLGAKYKFSKNLQLGMEQQVRFNDRMTSYNRTFTEIGLKWRFSKRFSLKPNYRFTIDPNNANSHRISGDLIYQSKKKKKDVHVKNRFRYQHKIESGSLQTTTYLRNKLTLSVNASKLVDPYFFGEIFYRLNGRNEFRAWRAGAGLDWKLSKKLGLTTFYLYESEINKKNNDKTHIVGAVLEWNIN